MKSSGRRRRITVVAILVALVLIVAFVFLIWIPKGHQITSAQANLASLQNQDAQAKAEIATLLAFKAQLPTAKAELVRMQTAIPAYPDLAQFMLAIEKISNESGVTYISIAPAEPVPNAAPSSGASPVTGLADVAVSLSVKGGYFQVLDFLNRLDNLPRLVVTSSLSLSGSGVSSSSASAGSLVSASIQAAIYSESLPVGVPGVPITSTTTTAPGSTTTTAAAG